MARAEVLHERGAVGAVVERRLVDVVGPVGRLGPVHGDVGAAHELVGASWHAAAPARSPMLAPTCRLERPTSIGGSMSGRDPLGDGRGASTSAPGRRTANSSPPRRATRSCRRTLAEAGTDLAEQSVAGRVAEGVVDLLEVVEVDHQQCQCLVRSHVGPAPRTAPSSSWASIRRLPSPVSSSVTAWWWLRRSAPAARATTEPCGPRAPARGRGEHDATEFTRSTLPSTRIKKQATETSARMSNRVRRSTSGDAARPGGAQPDRAERASMAAGHEVRVASRCGRCRPAAWYRNARSPIAITHSRRRGAAGALVPWTTTTLRREREQHEVADRVRHRRVPAG